MSLSAPWPITHANGATTNGTAQGMNAPTTPTRPSTSGQRGLGMVGRRRVGSP